MKLSILIVLLVFGSLASSNVFASVNENATTNFSPILFYGYQAPYVNGVNNIGISATSTPIVFAVTLLIIVLLAAAMAYSHKRHVAMKIAASISYDWYGNTTKSQSVTVFRESKWRAKRAATPRSCRV